MKRVFFYILAGMFAGVMARSLMFTPHALPAMAAQLTPPPAGDSVAPSLVVANCGTAPTQFPAAGNRAYDTIDTNGNKCYKGSAAITSLPGIVYNNPAITLLTNGQTETDVQITSNGGVIMSPGATVDGITALTAVSTSSVTDGKWAIDASPGNLYGYQIGSAATTVCYLQLFNAAAGSVTFGSTVPDMFIQVAGAAAGGVPTDMISPIPLKNFSTAMTAGFMTTPTGGTKCTAGATATIFIK
jgi:hypothetical protein